MDGFYYGESPHDLNLECWTTLAALAASTERIRLGPVIANVLPSYRSTHLLARQAAAISIISDGRLDFRTGVGASVSYGRSWWEPFGVDYPGYDRRLAETTNALATFRRLWADGPEIPVTVAATGSRALALAAAAADVWETSFATPDEFAERARRMDEMLDGRSILRCLEIDGFVATSQHRLDGLLATVRNDRGRDENLEEILRRGLVGTPNQVADQLGRLAAAGVDQVLVAAHDPHDEDLLEALAQAKAQV